MTSNTTLSGTIKPIDASSIHSIHSGQVVLNLESAVKELVENSLDAEATNIDVRIKNNGLDTVEVIDNGSGISPEDWPSIALKHHTSKLLVPSLPPTPTKTSAPTSPQRKQVPDLTTVSTFGFRGEALSALCTLCEKVEVITCTKEMKGLGKILEFDREGRLLDPHGKGVARQRGTTVILHNLFKPLPVRRKEFERNAKKEFAKLLTTMMGYGLVPCAGGWDGEPLETEGGVKRGVRLTVDAVNKAGKRTNHIRTTGVPSLQSSITSIFGPKMFPTLISVSLELSVDVDKMMAKREGLDMDTTLPVQVKGMISRAEGGMGRTGGGGQYWYLNGRPFLPGKIARAVNETYKSYNSHQTPVVILDFQLPKSSVDINVSPDKRTIYLHSEANLIDSLTVGLNEFFAPSRGVFTEQNHSVAPLSESLRGEAKATGNKEPLFLDEDAEMEIPQTSLQRKETGNNKVPGSVRDTSPLRRRERSPQEVSARSTGSLRLAPKPSTPSNLSVVDLMSSGIVIGTPSPTQKLPDSHFTPIDKKTLEYEEEDELDELESEDETIKGANRNRSPVILLSKDSTEDETLPTGKRKKLVQPTLTGLGGGWKLSKVENVTPASSEKRTVPKTQSRRSFRDRLMGFASQKAKVDLDEVHSDNGNDEADEVAVYTRPIEVDEPDGELTREPSSDNIDLDLERALNPDETQEHEISTSDLPDGTLAISHKHRSHRDDTQDGIEYIADGQDESQTPGELEEKAGFRNEIASRASKREITLTCDMDRIRRNYKASRRRLTPVEGNKLDTGRSEGLPREAFLPEAGVTITDAVKADRALSKVIKKQDFASMQVIGQYNRAFIIARNVSSDPGDPSNDLFIIDQHAADEKYNFETLQTVTKIQSQRLLKPKNLQLTAAEEITAMENLDILASNGFGLTVDESAPYGQGEKIRLTAMPVSKETTFDEKDLGELIFLLQDQYIGTMVRCKKARSMFAMRACRKSVMFGHSLTMRQMTLVARHMGEIDHPWNCPHGRPTMRHLVNLGRIETDRDSERRAHPRHKIDWSTVQM